MITSTAPPRRRKRVKWYFTIVSKKDWSMTALTCARFADDASTCPGESPDQGAAPQAQLSGLHTQAMRELIVLIFDQTDVIRVVAIIDARHTPALRLVLSAGLSRGRDLSGVFRGEP